MCVIKLIKTTSLEYTIRLCKYKICLSNKNDLFCSYSSFLYNAGEKIKHDFYRATIAFFTINFLKILLGIFTGENRLLRIKNMKVYGNHFN